MNHPTHKMLLDYFENELSPVKSEMVKDHLISCEQCSAYVEEHFNIEGVLKEMQRSFEIDRHVEDKIKDDARKLLQGIKFSKKRKWKFDVRLLIPATVIGAITLSVLVIHEFPRQKVEKIRFLEFATNKGISENETINSISDIENTTEFK